MSSLYDQQACVTLLGFPTIKAAEPFLNEEQVKKTAQGLSVRFKVGVMKLRGDSIEALTNAHPDEWLNALNLAQEQYVATTRERDYAVVQPSRGKPPPPPSAAAFLEHLHAAAKGSQVLKTAMLEIEEIYAKLCM